MPEGQIAPEAEGSGGGLARAVVVTGLIAGTLDITAAMIQFLIATGGANPLIVLQYIASGVFGGTAFSGSLLYPCAGLLFHFFIATSWTTLFFILYPRIALLRKSIILSGIAYGVFVWLCMTRVVVPFSAVRPVQHTLIRDLIAIGILMACIGIPIAWRARRYYSRKQPVSVADRD